MLIQLFEELNELNIDEFAMSWENDHLDIRNAQYISQINDIISNIQEEIMPNITDEKCINDISEIETLLLGMEEVINYKVRSLEEIESDLGYILEHESADDTVSEIEFERYYDIIENKADNISRIIQILQSLISHLQ